MDISTIAITPGPREQDCHFSSAALAGTSVFFGPGAAARSAHAKKFRLRRMI